MWALRLSGYYLGLKNQQLFFFFRKVDHSDANDWLKFNIGQRGYYRVQYPLDEWQKFSSILQKSQSQFSSSDRTSKTKIVIRLLIYDIFLVILRSWFWIGFYMNSTHYWFNILVFTWLDQKIPDLISQSLFDQQVCLPNLYVHELNSSLCHSKYAKDFYWTVDSFKVWSMMHSH